MASLLYAAKRGNMARVQELLLEGKASITDRDGLGNTALLLAARNGALPMCRWLLAEGGADIGERNNYGHSALLLSACYDHFTVARWLLEHGGADIAESIDPPKLGRGSRTTGSTIWDMMEENLVDQCSDSDYHPAEYDAAALHDLLVVMVLKGAPPARLLAEMAREHAQTVEHGARLMAKLPAYLARRHALLDAHCPLIAPLLALVHGYVTPTTTEEIWATGLGAAPVFIPIDDAGNEIEMAVTESAVTATIISPPSPIPLSCLARVCLGLQSVWTRISLFFE